jgi:hypothetical protein
VRKQNVLLKAAAACTHDSNPSICQGRYFGENQVFAAIVSLLHAFKISPALDEQGNPIIPAVKMSSGLTA